MGRYNRLGGMRCCVTHPLASEARSQVRSQSRVRDHQGARRHDDPRCRPDSVWIAAGHTDMRRGMRSLALQVQEGLNRDPHAGDLYVFRGKSGSLIKILWHDGIGMSLYAKRLERGRFIWPSATAGVVSISTPQLAGRNRLAKSPAHVAADGGRLSSE
jgi:transposase